MRHAVHWVVAALIVIHGLIHLLGVAKGFGWTEVAQLSEPIGKGMAFAWLAAGVVVTTTGVLFASRMTWWWIVGIVAVVLSQAVIITSWSDAKAGTVANVILLVAVVFGFFAEGPTGLRSEYRRRSAPFSAKPAVSGEPAALLQPEDLAHLPAVVARYIAAVGAIGKPRVGGFRAAIHGRIRSGPDEAWMPWRGEQVNTYGSGLGRVFYMDATMRGVPADVLHVYEGSAATMRVKVASLLTVVDAKGPEMDRAETVTLLNDMCIMAPGALADAPIEWTILGERRVRAVDTNAGHTVRAELIFDDDDQLVDFVSDDRYRTMADKTLLPQRWSTPLADYRDFSGSRVATFGQGWWHPEGEAPFGYLEFHIDHITYTPATNAAIH